MTAPAGDHLSARGLMGRPIRWNGIRLGRVSDVLLDRPAHAVVGLEVECPDGVSRFLALAACERFDAREVTPASPLALLDGHSLAFYRTRGVRLGAVLDRPIARNGHGRETLAEVTMQPDGTLVDLTVVAADGTPRTVPAKGLDVDDERGVVLLAPAAARRV